MCLAKAIREEIERRGMPLTRVAEETGMSYSTLRDFVASGAGLSIDRASDLAEFLGLELTTSKLRKQEMKDYMKTIEKLEKDGYDVDQDSVEAVAGMVENLKWLKSQGWDDFSTDDAEMTSGMVANLQWLANNGWDAISEDDAEMVASYQQNAVWLENNGWDYSEDDANAVEAFVQNLKWLEEQGEEAAPARMEEVAEFVANLESMD